jgi:hypothetical protein
MGKNSYESRASSSSSKFNGDVRVLECWCPRICVVRKSNTSKNPRRPFYVFPLPKFYACPEICVLGVCKVLMKIG